MLDERLVGTWRSDRKRTAADIAARRDIPAKKRRKILPIFGHLVLRYTRRGRCHSTFRGDKEVTRYRVLGKTADSVVVESRPQHSNKDWGPSIYHLRFESLGPSPSCYWIALGSFREFFRRVKAPPNKRLQRTRSAPASRRSPRR